MILKALYDLARGEELIDDPDFEFKPVSWVVRLRDNGTLIKIEDWREPRPGRSASLVGKKTRVSVQAVRTSGDMAFFLVDKAEYALGVNPGAAATGPKTANRARLFREQVDACARATGDSAVLAVSRFLANLPRSLSEPVPPDLIASDLIGFIVGSDSFVHLRVAVMTYWKSLRQQQPEGDSDLRCLITGQRFAQVEGLPMVKKLPGGTPSGVALVSHNARAFESYGLAGSENAPISREAAESAMKALNRLLDPEPVDGKGHPLKRRHIRLSGDTAVVYWAVDAGASDAMNALSDLLEAEDPSAVADVYRSVWSGQALSLPVNPAAFYAMTLTGTQGRAVVRDWLESNVPAVMANLARHFADLAIVRNTPPPRGRDLPPALSLRLLMDCLTPPGGEVPAALAAEFIRSALQGGLYPMALLQRALMRHRAEIGNTDWIDLARRGARAALIKGFLNRRRRFHSDAAARYAEVTPDMNPHSNSPGYNAGALLSIIERLQTLALGDVNASVIDRYFAAASATPRVVFDRLLKGARHHARKAADENPGAVFGLERLLDELASRFDPAAGGFPAHLDLEQQGLFVLGYHQTRKFLWMNADERAAWEAAHPDAPRAFVRSRRSETQLESSKNALT